MRNLTDAELTKLVKTIPPDGSSAFVKVRELAIQEMARRVLILLKEAGY